MKTSDKKKRNTMKKSVGIAMAVVSISCIATIVETEEAFAMGRFRRFITRVFTRTPRPQPTPQPAPEPRLVIKDDTIEHLVNTKVTIDYTDVQRARKTEGYEPFYKPFNPRDFTSAELKAMEKYKEKISNKTGTNPTETALMKKVRELNPEQLNDLLADKVLAIKKSVNLGKPVEIEPVNLSVRRESVEFIEMVPRLIYKEDEEALRELRVKAFMGKVRVSDENGVDITGELTLEQINTLASNDYLRKQPIPKIETPGSLGSSRPISKGEKPGASGAKVEITKTGKPKPIEQQESSQQPSKPVSKVDETSASGGQEQETKIVKSGKANKKSDRKNSESDSDEVLDTFL